MTRNRTGDLPFCRTMLSPLSHNGQGGETGFLLSACREGGNRSVIQGHLAVDSDLHQNGDDYLVQELGETNAWRYIDISPSLNRKVHLPV